MAAIRKLIERLKTIPADLTWDELVRVLSSFGYVEKKGKGSSRKFRGDGLPAINLHEPHPAKIVKRYALRYVLETLESEGLL
jgi:predicted RNA binding protein YcfA (HicA-like mRNA interferase family)